MKANNNPPHPAAGPWWRRSALVLSASALACCGRPSPSADTRGRPEQVTVSGLPAAAAYLVQSPSQLVVSAQALVTPLSAGRADSIPLTGYVAPDPRRERQVSARAGGRVERLYVRYNYQYVQAGQRLLDLYSPELNTAVREYQYLLAQGVDADLQQRSRTRLRLLGVSVSQLAKGSKEAIATLPIVSPYAGYVVPRPAAAAPAAMPAAGGGMVAAAAGDDGMGSGPAAPAASSTAPTAGSALREGGYVAPGDMLFSINDLRQVWGILAVEARYVARVRPGQRVRLRSELNTGQPIEARVAYIEPAFAPDQKFLQVRVYLDNAAGQLKVNSLLTGTLEAPVPRGLQLPSSSVYDVGRRHLVWVFRGNTAAGRRLFEARIVTTGPLGGPMVTILAGLGPQEKVARDAGYLVDSESFLDTQTP